MVAPDAADIADAAAATPDVPPVDMILVPWLPWLPMAMARWRRARGAGELSVLCGDVRGDAQAVEDDAWVAVVAVAVVAVAVVADATAGVQGLGACQRVSTCTVWLSAWTGWLAAGVDGTTSRWLDCEYYM